MYNVMPYFCIDLFYERKKKDQILTEFCLQYIKNKYPTKFHVSNSSPNKIS